VFLTGSRLLQAHIVNTQSPHHLLHRRRPSFGSRCWSVPFHSANHSLTQSLNQSSSTCTSLHLQSTTPIVTTKARCHHAGSTTPHHALQPSHWPRHSWPRPSPPAIRPDQDPGGPLVQDKNEKWANFLYLGKCPWGSRSRCTLAQFGRVVFRGRCGGLRVEHGRQRPAPPPTAIVAGHIRRLL